MSAATSTYSTGAIDELRQYRHWVSWHYVERTRPDGSPYQTKVPINPRTGGNASVTDPETWSTYDHAQVVCRRRKLDGIGFVLTASLGIVGWDLDQCIHEDGTIEPWAEEIVHTLNTSTMQTPSRTGLRLLAHGSLPPADRKEGPIEAYIDGRFLTITGENWPGAPDVIEDRPAEMLAMHTKYLHREKPAPAPARPAQPTNLGDQELLDKARAARNGSAFAALWDGDTSAYGSHSEADLALCGMLAFWTGGDTGRVDQLFRQSSLMREKWDTGRSGSTYGANTVAKAVSGRSEFYTPAPTLQVRAAPPKPPEIPLDANISDTLRAYVERLAFIEEENTQLRARLTETEAELAELRQERSLYFGVLKNRAIPAAERITYVAALNLHASDTSLGKVDNEGFSTASAAKVAEAAGQPESTVSRHLQRLGQDGLLERKIVPDVAKFYDQETGEITERPIDRVLIRLSEKDLNTALQAAAIAQPVRKRPGGFRPRCPKHPNAGTVTHWTLRCAECGDALDSGRIEHQPPIDDEAGSHNESRESAAGAQPPGNKAESHYEMREREDTPPTAAEAAPPASHYESRETEAAAENEMAAESSVHVNHASQIGVWPQESMVGAAAGPRPSASPPPDLWKSPGLCLGCSGPLPPGRTYYCAGCAATAAAPPRDEFDALGVTA